MKLNIFCILTILAISIAGCTSNRDIVNTQTNSTVNEGGRILSTSEIDTALLFMESFRTGNSEILSSIDENFKLHRPEYPSNMETLESWFPGEPTGMVINTIRSFVDGNIVVTHNYTSEYPWGPPMVSIDIFGIENGKIKYYWDNMEVEAEERANPHTQYDGSTAITDIDKTEMNKALIEEYTDAVFIQKDIEVIDKYVGIDSLIQHAPAIMDGRDALKEYLRTTNPQYSELKKVLGEGNFVLTICDGTKDDQPAAFFDLYRVENNLIVEHWEVIETILPEENWANENGKTNFDY